MGLWSAQDSKESLNISNSSFFHFFQKFHHFTFFALILVQVASKGKLHGARVDLNSALPRSQGIWPWPEPLPRKMYNFTSMNRVPVTQICPVTQWSRLAANSEVNPRHRSDRSGSEVLRILYRCVRKYPNDQFFWHNFFVCGCFSTNFSGFLHNMNTHIHKLLPGIYRYLYISWIKKSKNASTESFRTLWYFRFKSK
jgi:hypothetical protein